MAVELIVYTRAWNVDEPAANVDDATAHVACRVFVVGPEIGGEPLKTELASILSAELLYDVNGFAVATLKFSAAAVKVVPVTEAEWRAIGK